MHTWYMRTLVLLFLLWGVRSDSDSCCEVYSVVFYGHNSSSLYSTMMVGHTAFRLRVEVVSGLVGEDNFVPSRGCSARTRSIYSCQRVGGARVNKHNNNNNNNNNNNDNNNTRYTLGAPAVAKQTKPILLVVILCRSKRSPWYTYMRRCYLLSYIGVKGRSITQPRVILITYLVHSKEIFEQFGFWRPCGTLNNALRPLLMQSDLQSVGNGAISASSHELLPRKCAKNCCFLPNNDFWTCLQDILSS